MSCWKIRDVAVAGIKTHISHVHLNRRSASKQHFVAQLNSLGVASVQTASSIVVGLATATALQLAGDLWATVLIDDTITNSLLADAIESLDAQWHRASCGWQLR